MSTIRTWEDAYTFFYWYFDHNLDINKTLREYGLLTGKNDPAKASSIWRDLKKKYPEDYRHAKADFMEAHGISEPNLLILTYDIAMNSVLDRDRLKAIDLLDRLMKTSSDANIMSAANSLTIKVIPPTTPVQELAEDIQYYEEEEE